MAQTFLFLSYIVIEYSSDSKYSDMTVVAEDDAYKPEKDDQPVPLTQAELKKLTRDLIISKSAQLLDSRLKEKHRLELGQTFYWYRDREKELK